MISEDAQYARDFDWFAVDEVGCIAHFTTAGFKLLPKSVASSAEDLKKVTEYFWQLAPTGAGHRVSATLEKKTEQYLRDFSYMAERGLYSFNIDTYGGTDLEYFLVAIPNRPLSIETLPSEIRAIVGQTRLKRAFLADASRISYEWTVAL